MAIFTRRPHDFAPERLWTVGPEALTWKDDKGKGRLASANLAKLRLACTPTRVKKNRFLRSLKSVDGHSLPIGKETYRGRADFENCSTLFREGVQP